MTTALPPIGSFLYHPKTNTLLVLLMHGKTGDLTRYGDLFEFGSPPKPGGLCNLSDCPRLEGKPHDHDTELPPIRVTDGVPVKYLRALHGVDLKGPAMLVAPVSHWFQESRVDWRVNYPYWTSKRNLDKGDLTPLTDFTGYDTHWRNTMAGVPLREWKTAEWGAIKNTYEKEYVPALVGVLNDAFPAPAGTAANDGEFVRAGNVASLADGYQASSEDLTKEVLRNSVIRPELNHGGTYRWRATTVDRLLVGYALSKADPRKKSHFIDVERALLARVKRFAPLHEEKRAIRDQALLPATDWVEYYKTNPPHFYVPPVPEDQA